MNRIPRNTFERFWTELQREMHLPRRNRNPSHNLAKVGVEGSNPFARSSDQPQASVDPACQSM